MTDRYTEYLFKPIINWKLYFDNSHEWEDFDWYTIDKMPRVYFVSVITLLALLAQLTIADASNCTVTLSMHRTCSPSHKQVL